ncbi:unnamed protein product [Caretta caretta]
MQRQKGKPKEPVKSLLIPHIPYLELNGEKLENEPFPMWGRKEWSAAVGFQAMLSGLSRLGGTECALRGLIGASAFLGTLDPHEYLVPGGDFNTTLEERDRSGVETSQAAAGVLREIVDHHSLVDVWRDHHPDDDVTFTYVRVEGDQSRHSRLDHIYISHFHLARAYTSGIRPAPFLDHRFVTVTASLSPERPGPAYWHFNNSLLEDVGFVASFREFWPAWWGQRHVFPSATQWWDVGKVRAWLFCRDYTWGATRRRDAVIGQLEREVLELERFLTSSPEDPSLRAAYWEKREELRALEDHRARGAFVRSHMQPRVLYAEAECLVRLNWTLTEPVSFGRGVRQGCPLLGQLYALAIEPFLRLLRRRLTGLALQESELRLVLSAYADDMLLVVQDTDDLVRVEACQAVYSAASSAWVNRVKSPGLVVGDGWQASSLPPCASSHSVECGSAALSWCLSLHYSCFSARELAGFRGQGG